MKSLFPLLIAGLFLASTAQAQNTAAPQEEAATLDLNHIGFAVTKLDDTVSFFVDILGWKTAGGRPEYPAKFVTNGNMFVTLWQVNDPAKAVAFDRKNNVGLHHLALTVKSLEALDVLYKRFLDYEGVVIEFAPEPNGGGPTIHMMIREPSGNRLEFAYTPPKQ